MQRIAVIDGDTVLYRAAHAAQVSVDLGDGFFSPVGDLREATDRVRSDVVRYLAETGAASGYFALSETGRHYRMVVDPEYKADRSAERRPVLFGALRAALSEVLADLQVQVELWPGLEADDVVGILATATDHVPGREAVMVSLDKDLRTVPGHLFNPQRGTHAFTTPEEAFLRILHQTLTGDRVDGYAGCPGIGEKRAAKLLGEPGAGWHTVVGAFVAAGQTPNDALRTYRLAAILRSTDAAGWDNDPAVRYPLRVHAPTPAAAADWAAPLTVDLLELNP